MRRPSDDAATGAPDGRSGISWSSRSKTAIRLIAAIGTLGLLVCGSLIFSLAAFDGVRRGYDQLADETVPQMTDAARIAQISQAIVSTAPNLATAESDYARQTLRNEVHDRLRDLDRYLDGVNACPDVSQQDCVEALVRIGNERAALVENLEALDQAVAELLAARAAVDESIDRVEAAIGAALAQQEAWAEEAIGLTAAGATGAGEAAGLRRELRLLQALLSMSRQRSTALVRRSARQMQPILRDLFDHPPPSADHGTAAAVTAELHATIAVLSDAETGLAAQVQALVELNRRVGGIVGNNRRLANRFVGAIANLTETLETHTLAERDGFAALVQDTLVVLTTVAALSLVWVLGLSLFIRRAVVRRLHRLRDSMRDRVYGREVPIPTEGADEISEIGEAAQFFLQAIEERETGLRLAKEAAEALAAEAASANASKSRFLANMSHELRTPLNSIIGFSELITSGIRSGEDATEYAAIIHKSGSHLLTLINEILDLSQIEAGQKDLTLVELSPIEMLQAIEPIVRLQFERRGVGIAMHVPCEARISADERAFRQVFLNLLANAGKFAHPHTTVEILGRRIDGRLHLTVRDEGVGIARANLARVLEPFHQEVDPSRRQTEGVGLGLSIVDALVRMHGGATRMSSELGVGTAVTVDFALADAAESWNQAGGQRTWAAEANRDDVASPARLRFGTNPPARQVPREAAP